jgi:hypothetical protein
VLLEEILDPVLAAGLLVGDEDEADVIGRRRVELVERLLGAPFKEIIGCECVFGAA